MLGEACVNVFKRLTRPSVDDDDVDEDVDEDVDDDDVCLFLLLSEWLGAAISQPRVTCLLALYCIIIILLDLINIAIVIVMITTIIIFA